MAKCQFGVSGILQLPGSMNYIVFQKTLSSKTLLSYRKSILILIFIHRLFRLIPDKGHLN